MSRPCPHREDGVFRRWWAEVHTAAPAGPYICVPARIFLERLRLVFNRVRLPEDFSGGGVKSSHAAAEFAAFVVDVGTGKFLLRRHRNVELVFVKRDGTGDAGVEHRVDARLPDARAGGCIDGIRGAVHVTKINREFATGARKGSYCNGGAQTCVGLRLPIGAASLRVERKIAPDSPCT